MNSYAAEKKHYFMNLNPDFTDDSGHHYVVGEDITSENTFKGDWPHFYERIGNCWLSGRSVVEVEPLSEVVHVRMYPCQRFARSVRVLRELTHEEIVKEMLFDRCDGRQLLQLHPSYEELLSCKGLLKGYYEVICYRMDHLTEEQKINLLPSRWHKRVHEFESGRPKALFAW